MTPCSAFCAETRLSYTHFHQVEKVGAEKTENAKQCSSDEEMEAKNQRIG